MSIIIDEISPEQIIEYKKQFHNKERKEKKIIKNEQFEKDEV